MKRILAITAILVLVALLYLMLWPVDLEPVAWQPPDDPGLEGRYVPNQDLAAVQWLDAGDARGPEDVAVDSQGRVIGGFDDGRIIRLNADDGVEDVLADTGGRPLGLAWAADGTLIIADAEKGLLALAPSGNLRTLSTAAAGIPLGFTNDVDVAADGTIYFSDASSRFGIHQVNEDILEHGGHGRLMRYRPDTRTTEVLLSGLQFANGVALGPDDAYVLVAETGSYRIRRYWLTGPRSGEVEVFHDNLPGFPDGVSFDGRDTFWVALYAPRNALLDRLADRPWLRKVVYRLPQFLQPAAAHHGFVLGLGLDGEVRHNLQHRAPEAFAPITSVEAVDEGLYLGSLTQPAIGYLPLSAAPNPDSDSG